MKKNVMRLLAVAAVSSVGFTAVSCSRGDDPVVDNTVQIDPNNFKGTIESGKTLNLNANTVYYLTGSLIVKDGGVLNIPAGTKIVASGGTQSYVLVEQGGKAFMNGTASSPIVFTSATAVPGAWGGIVLCGKAPINKGTTATSEVGNSIYGGTVANDNSGTMNYVRIENAGAIFTADKEFNGLSLFGVGNGTTISNISIINGSDDGIEFFGGTVNATNLVIVGNEDDSLDWTEGWNGTATNVYAKRRANGTGNRGIEGDNNSNDNNANPRSNPTIKNATFVGAAGGESDGFKLRVGTYATIDNAVLSGWATGINLEHDATVTFFNGTGKLTNIRMEGVTKEVSAKSSAGATVAVLPNTYTVNASATGAGNGVNLPTWAAGWSGVQ